MFSLLFYFTKACDANQRVEFTCVFKSKPKADILWFFGDKQLIENDDEARYFMHEETRVQEDAELNVAKLKVQNVFLGDAGAYKCKLRNCAGEAASSGMLAIYKSPRITHALPAALELNEKSILKIECKIASDTVPKPTVAWFKDSAPLSASKRILISKPLADEETGSIIQNLTITDASALDSGVYTVKVTNKVASVESGCNVSVLSAPKIIKDLKPAMECSKGDTVKLEVNAVGKPIPEFKWYHFNAETNSQEELSSVDETVSIRVQSENLYVLEFAQIAKAREGKYTLKLSNKAGSVETACNLTINMLPVVIKPLESITVSEGSECTFVVVVNGNPNPSIEWYKNDAKLKPDKRYSAKTEEKTETSNSKIF